MRGLKKLHKPRNNKNNEHISGFGKTSVGGNADTGSLTTTRLRNRLSAPCSGLLMWSVQRSAALLRTWPGCLIHSGLCVVACWCWKPPTPGIRGDTFYLPQAGKLNISFPQIKKKKKKRIKGIQARVTAVVDGSSERSFLIRWYRDTNLVRSERKWEDVWSGMGTEQLSNVLPHDGNVTPPNWEVTWRLQGNGSTGFGPVNVAYINKQRVSCLTLCDSGQILAF